MKQYSSPIVEVVRLNFEEEILATLGYESGDGDPDGEN